MFYAKPLEERIAILGESWADHVRESLRSDQRRPSGMWPGTVTEARALVIRALAVPDGPPPSPTPDERERLTRALYAVARQRWLSRREPEAADDDPREPADGI